MTVAIGGDHLAVDLKLVIIKHLQARGHQIIDCGTTTRDRTNYPVFGRKVGAQIATGRCQRGVVICGTGIGIINAANKIKGVRAVLVNSISGAEHAVRTLNTHIIALGAQIIGPGLACLIVDRFLSAQYFPTTERKELIGKINGLIKHENY